MSTFFASRVLAGIFFFASPAMTFASAEDQPRQSLPVNIFLAKNSVWTRAEVLNRLNHSRSIFLNSCNLDLSLKGFVESSDPSFQDLNLDFGVEGSEQKRKLSGAFPQRQGAVLLYVRKIFGEGESSGLSPEAHLGLIPISEEQSQAHPDFASKMKTSRDLDFEAHQLGHFFLKDVRLSPESNIMASQESLYRSKFDAAQCARLRENLKSGFETDAN